MTFFSLTLDADGHWIVTCDRCSRDLRSERSHENMSSTMLAAYMDELHEHFHSLRARFVCALGLIDPDRERRVIRELEEAGLL